MNFPDLGATGIIAAVIVALATIGFLKGLIRTVLALVCLGIAGYAALWGNEHANDLTAPWMANPGPWMPKAIAIVTGLIVFSICRYLLNFLIDPFDRSKTGKKIGFGLPAAALSLCAGLVILWLGFTGIRYGGTLAELRHTRHLVLNQGKADTADYTAPLLLRAKQALDASSAGKWQRDTDPFYSPERLTLCKLLILYHHAPTREEMLRDSLLNPLLNHELFLQLAYAEEIQSLSQSGRPRLLFHAAPIDTFLQESKGPAMLHSLPSGYLDTFLPTAQ